MLESIRIALFKKNLRQWLAAHRRRPTTHTLQSAGNIAVLFDATRDAQRREVLDIVKNLEKSGKKVRLLGFYNQKQVAETPDFDFFTNKELSWTYEPKAEKARAFAQSKPDLLLLFNPDQLAPLAWLAAHVQAGMKIGPAGDLPQDFDLQLETPKDKGPKFFMEQLQMYLSTIVLHKK
jgi:hypothetical protein